MTDTEMTDTKAAASDAYPYIYNSTNSHPYICNSTGYQRKTPGEMHNVMDSKPPPSEKEVKAVSALLVPGK